MQWERAARGESGVGRLTRFPLRDDFPVRIAGQVAEIDTAPYPFLSPRSLALWPSPLFKYALLVVHRALAASGVVIAPELAPRVAVTFSSAIGGLDAVLAADRRMIAEGKLPPPYANPNSCINMVGGKIAMLTGATGPITSTITACATGVTSMIVGGMLLEAGRADVADLRGGRFRAGRADRGRIRHDERRLPAQGRGRRTTRRPGPAAPFRSTAGGLSSRRGRAASSSPPRPSRGPTASRRPSRSPGGA